MRLFKQLRAPRPARAPAGLPALAAQPAGAGVPLVALPGARPPAGAATAPSLALCVASDDDFDALLSLRLAAMHESLQRLGRFDPERARERLSRGFEPAHTRHILADGERVGFVVLLPAAGHLVLDHLYITPGAQGRGIGAWVMAQVLAQADAAGLPVQVTALKLSAANRFYLRHGFVLQVESEWDMHYLRPAAQTAQPGLPACGGAAPAGPVADPS